MHWRIYHLSPTGMWALMKTGAFSCLLLYLQHLEYYLWYNTLFLNKYVLNKAQEYAWGAGQWGLVLLPIGGLDCKASAWDSGDLGLIPGPGRSSREGSGNLHQYSCLENSIDRGAWWAPVHGVTKIGHGWVTNTFTFTLIHFGQTVSLHHKIKVNGLENWTD